MPAKNKLSDLRDHLFETLEALRDKEEPMDLKRAHAVAQVAGKIIDTAKVEVQYAKAIGADVSGEFFEQIRRPALAPAPDQRVKEEHRKNVKKLVGL